MFLNKRHFQVNLQGTKHFWPIDRLEALKHNVETLSSTHRPEVPESSGRSLEMQILGPFLRPNESKLAFWQDPQEGPMHTTVWEALI